MDNHPDSLDRKTLLKNAVKALNEMQSRLDAMEHSLHEPIAIIGMGCRFPGEANSPDEYWNLLSNSIDAIQPVPPERWNIHDFDDLQIEQPIAWYGGFLKNIDKFDAQFFNISPREANTMDPQQRLVLEVAWEALENAGVTTNQFSGSQTGVFVGVTTSDYGQLLREIDPTKLDIYAATGSAMNAIAGRVAFALGLHGPTVSVDTACSSSLVAIHLACQSLRSGEVTMALAGGVNAVITPEAYISFARWGMMAPDARCKTFDVRADGFVRGEGCGILLLKRLSDAQAAGDRILAVIHGSAVNNDGRSSGLTVPNGLAQQAAIRSALKVAGISPGQVSYVETHGTGTSLGDPIEIEALGAVLGEGRPEDAPLVISSVKTNLGHLESASGVAGMIKVVLSMLHEEIPPHLHLQERSPRIPWPSFPVEIPTQALPWPAEGQPRFAGVSSFGFSGTNAHIVLGEAPRQAQASPSEQAPETTANLLVLSGKVPQAVRDQADRYAQFLVRADGAALNRICRTAALGRTPMNHRLAVAGSREELQTALAAFASGESPKGAASGQVERGGPGKIAFLFTGQGSQWIGMGKQLYEQQPVFRQAMDHCADLLRPYLAEPLLSVIFSENGSAPLLDQTTFTQPALFALEYSLAMLWQSWGIKPYAVLGHSVGEYAAACAAGVFSLEDGLKLIAARARLMGSLPQGGQMAAVFASEADVREILSRCSVPVSIAAINGPESVVISGAGSAVEMVVELLQQEGIQTRPMNVSHAFHSSLMDPILDSFEQTAQEIEYHLPELRVISNVTGQAEAELFTSAAYWQQHIRKPVRFYEGIQSLYEQGCRLFVEIGPHPVLIGMAQHGLPDGLDSMLWLPSLRKNHADLPQILESLGAIWVHGAAVDWQALYQDTAAQPVDLPTYPFQRQRYWLEAEPKTPEKRQIPQDQLHPLLGTRLSSPLLKDVVYETNLWVDQPAFLNDHRLYGAPIFPGTGYLEIGQAAARLMLPGQQVRLENISIINLLNLPEEDKKTIQVILTTAQNGEPARYRVFSQNASEMETWTLHAEGAVLPHSAHLPAQGDTLAEVRARCETELSGAEYYQLFDAVWFAYGPSFKCIQKIWRKDYESVGELALPHESAATANEYILHPGLLDACIQLLGAAIPHFEQEINKGIFYAPVSIKNYQIQAAGCARLTAHTQLEPLSGASDMMIGNMWLYDEAGSQVGVVEEIILRKVTQEMIAAAAHPARDTNNLYTLNWIEATQPKMKEGKAVTGQWLIIDGEGGIGQAAAEAIKVQGGASQLVSLSEADKAIGALLQDTTGSDPLRGVMYCAGSELMDMHSSEQLQSFQQTVLGGLVKTAQSLLCAQPGTAGIPALVVLTRGAQAVLAGDTVSSLPQSTVWGTARSIANEHPELKCVVIDLDPLAPPEAAAQQLYTALQAVENEEGENQMVFRAGGRYFARLGRMDAAKASPSGGEMKPAILSGETPFKLFIKERGVLDNIELRPTDHAQLKPNQVKIAVKAAGLNFRDVLNVLGLLPDASPDLGHECAGVITSVGEAVTHCKVGDAVMGIATGSFASHVTTHEDLVIQKPAAMSFIEAATIPITFLTTYFALVRLAQIKKGDRVLIHSAAGGVGMAAVQIAQQAGAEIYATAGSEEKRSLLKSLGVPYVMDSRTLQFADQIMEWTNGEGVDMVLNALTDDFLQRSFSVLKPGGCFLEIGKRGILTHEQVDAMGKNYEYHIIFLGAVCEEEPGLIQEMLQSLVADFSSGALKPLNSTLFPIENAAEAFRYMAQAKHIGKVVLTLPENAAAQPESSTYQPAEISEAASYLITGGLGGIGLKTAQWLSSKGARSLVLVSRRPPVEETQQELEQIRATGAQVTILTGDVSNEEDVLRILHEIETSLPPLRGIFHAAGVLEDTAFTEMDWPKMERALAPKVYGGWNLHRHTLDLPLDYFVLFSAGAAVFGPAGQANYAGANAYLDSLAHYRRARGLPALSINWGPWAEVGMAARSTKALQNRWTQQGVTLMKPDSSLQAMEKILCTGVTQAVVISIDWPVFLNQFPLDRRPPLLLDLYESLPVLKKPEQETQAPASQLQQLFSTEPEQRKSVLNLQIRALVGQVTGVKDPEQIQPSYGLVELGIDSLMIVELRNRINQAYHIDIQLSSLFKFPSLMALSDHMAGLILKTEALSAEGAPLTGDREEINL